MRPRFLLLFLMICLCVAAHAQNEERKIHLSMETRADYQRDYDDGRAEKDECGFKGKYLNLRMYGKISDRLSYDFNQRLNKMHSSTSFFDATDWLYVDYRATDRWMLSAGKLVIGVGGYEYDAAPIDLYFCSEFWNVASCYAWGAALTYHFSPSDKLMAQVCESPFRSHYRHADMYAYNLMWYGSHGRWNALWSMNMMEWAEHRYIHYISLGNEFHLADGLKLQLDVMNRAASGQAFFLRDCSVIGELSYCPAQKWRLLAKASYEVNHADKAADLCVMPGTELTRVGAGVEYFPLGSKDLRLHAYYCRSWGTNTNPDGIMQDNEDRAGIGLTWRIHILKR